MRKNKIEEVKEGISKKWKCFENDLNKTLQFKKKKKIRS